MTTITVPVPKDQLEYVDNKVSKGEFDNRSQFVRKAIQKMIEEQEIKEILDASRLAKMGQVFEGDLDMLLKKHA